MGTTAVSAIFDPTRWREVEGFDFTDITYHRHIGPRPRVRRRRTAIVDLPTVRIAFDRPEVRNAFRPHTVDELYRALDHARMTGTSAASCSPATDPAPRDGGWAFCSGGDQRIRGRTGYQYAEGDTADTVDPAARRPAAHPRGAAADPVHAEDRHRGRPRLGGRRRALAARRLRPHPRQRASTPGSSRPTPTSDRSTPATARRTSPGWSGRSSPGRSSSSAANTPPSRCTRWARSTRWCRTPSWRPSRCNGPRRSTANRRRRSGC